MSIFLKYCTKLCSDFQKFSLLKNDDEIKAQKLDKILQPLHHAMLLKAILVLLSMQQNY